LLPGYSKNTDCIIIQYYGIIVNYIKGYSLTSLIYVTIIISSVILFHCLNFIIYSITESTIPEKLTSLEPKLPALFADTGKAWLEELF